METSITYIYNDLYEVIETHFIRRSKRTIKNGKGNVLYVENFGVDEAGNRASSSLGFLYDYSGKIIKKMCRYGSNDR